MRDREMSGKMKRLKRKMEVQKITFNHFAWPQPRNWNFLCNDDDGHTKNIVVWFQNLLWVYGMAWMRVRFPGLKFCSSPPLVTVMNDGLPVVLGKLLSYSMWHWVSVFYSRETKCVYMLKKYFNFLTALDNHFKVNSHELVAPLIWQGLQRSGEEMQ